MIVVFPAPVCPTNAAVSPARMVNETFLRTHSGSPPPSGSF